MLTFRYGVDGHILQSRIDCPQRRQTDDSDVLAVLDGSNVQRTSRGRV